MKKLKLPFSSWHKKYGPVSFKTSLLERQCCLPLSSIRSCFILRHPETSVLSKVQDIWGNWSFSLCTTAEHIFVLPKLVVFVFDNGLVTRFPKVCLWFWSWTLLWPVAGSSLHCTSWPHPCFRVPVSCHCPHHWFQTHCIWFPIQGESSNKTEIENTTVALEELNI